MTNEFLGGIQIHKYELLKYSLSKISNNNRQNEYYLTDIVEHISINNTIHSCNYLNNQLYQTAY